MTTTALPSAAVLLHLAFAAPALALGPLALAARKGGRLHRASGRLWALLMLGTALSSFFIRDFRLPNVAGYTPIHLLSEAVLVTVPLAVVRAVRGDRVRHRRMMVSAYASLVVAGLLTLLPRRFLGQLLWNEALGLNAAPLIPRVLGQTPAWVWALLLGLIVLGALQLRRRVVSRGRLVALPLGLAGFSLSGAASAFGATPSVLPAWAAALATVVVLARRLPLAHGERTPTGDIAVPGSAWPLVVMLAIFGLRYGVNVSLVLQPDAARTAGFALSMAAAYGALSGVFVARALALLRPAPGRAEDSAARLPFAAAPTTP